MQPIEMLPTRMSPEGTTKVAHALKAVDETNGDVADAAADFADEYGPLILRRLNNDPDLVDAMTSLAEKLSTRRSKQQVLNLALLGR